MTKYKKSVRFQRKMYSKRKRVYRRSRNGDLRVTRYSRALYWNGSPFPREYTTQLTYAENISVTSTAGVPYTYLYTFNGLYDPNITGTGGQPRYLDTLCGANNGTAPYLNYRVFASKISIQAFPTGSDAMTMRGWLGLGLYNTTATGPSTLAEMRARGDYKVRFVNYWYASNALCKMSRYAKVKSLFDIKDVKDDNDLVGDYTTNPSKQGRWAITWQPYDETATRSIQVLVKIQYYVTFFNRNDVADS